MVRSESVMCDFQSQASIETKGDQDPSGLNSHTARNIRLAPGPRRGDKCGHSPNVFPAGHWLGERCLLGIVSSVQELV